MTGGSLAEEAASSCSPPARGGWAPPMGTRTRRRSARRPPLAATQASCTSCPRARIATGTAESRRQHAGHLWMGARASAPEVACRPWPLVPAVPVPHGVCDAGAATPPQGAAPAPPRAGPEACGSTSCCAGRHGRGAHPSTACEGAGPALCGGAPNLAVWLARALAFATARLPPDFWGAGGHGVKPWKPPAAGVSGPAGSDAEQAAAAAYTVADPGAIGEAQAYAMLLRHSTFDLSALTTINLGYGVENVFWRNACVALLPLCRCFRRSRVSFACLRAFLRSRAHLAPTTT